jgi:nucleoside-triphosphatase
VNIILTGVPGIGKTTLAARIAESLGDRAGGVITGEIREEGSRTGFVIESLDGERRILASKHLRRGPRVGRYRVDVENLDAVGIGALRRALDRKQIIVIDEIGKMELISAGFRAMILEALDSRLPTVATMGVSKNTFTEAVRKRPDAEVIFITTENRDALKDRVLELIERAIDGVNPGNC